MERLLTSCRRQEFVSQKPCTKGPNSLCLYLWGIWYPLLSDGHHYSLCICLVRFIIAAMKDHDQSNLCMGGGGMQVFGICFHIIGHHKRKSEKELKQVRDQEAGADAEVLTGLLLLIGLFSMDCTPCFI